MSGALHAICYNIRTGEIMKRIFFLILLAVFIAPMSASAALSDTIPSSSPKAAFNSVKQLETTPATWLTKFFQYFKPRKSANYYNDSLTLANTYLKKAAQAAASGNDTVAERYLGSYDQEFDRVKKFLDTSGQAASLDLDKATAKATVLHIDTFNEMERHKYGDGYLKAVASAKSDAVTHFISEFAGQTDDSEIKSKLVDYTDPLVAGIDELHFQLDKKLTWLASIETADQSSEMVKSAAVLAEAEILKEFAPNIKATMLEPFVSNDRKVRRLAVLQTILDQLPEDSKALVQRLLGETEFAAGAEVEAATLAPSPMPTKSSTKPATRKTVTTSGEVKGASTSSTTSTNGENINVSSKVTVEANGQQVETKSETKTEGTTTESLNINFDRETKIDTTISTDNCGLALTVTRGTEVSLTVRNETDAKITYAIEGIASKAINDGSRTSFKFTPTKPGSYPITCSHGKSQVMTVK